MAALLREWYRQNEGGGTAVPSPALTKAVLANSATDLVGGDSGPGARLANVPNSIQGWGLGNLADTLDGTARYFRDQVEAVRRHRPELRRSFTVADTGAPVKVTMAFTDTFGTDDGNSFVNDLNLTVPRGPTPSGGTSSRAVSPCPAAAPIRATTWRASTSLPAPAAPSPSR